MKTKEKSISVSILGYIYCGPKCKFEEQSVSACQLRGCLRNSAAKARERGHRLWGRDLQSPGAELPPSMDILFCSELAQLERSVTQCPPMQPPGLPGDLPC